MWGYRFKPRALPSPNPSRKREGRETWMTKKSA